MRKHVLMYKLLNNISDNHLICQMKKLYFFQMIYLSLKYNYGIMDILYNCVTAVRRKHYYQFNIHDYV